MQQNEMPGQSRGTSQSGSLPPCCGAANVPSSAPNRRGVLGSLIAWILGLIALAPSLVTGLAAFLAPLRSGRKGGLLVRLTTLDNLPKDGSPRKFPIVAEKRNGWTLSREPVGAVYLRLLPDGTVQALHVVCPHAGCAVEYRPGQGQGNAGEFFCPCHLARFDLDGKRLDAVSPSPRDMDTLSVEIRNGQEIWVEFQNFQVGTAQKIPVA
ncbi:MAG: Rieske (2Fe-2S) protein [Thermogutta sp.]